MRVLSYEDVSPVAPADCLTPIEAWRRGWARPAFRYSWLLLLGLMFGVLLPFVPNFFLAIQARPGSALADPLLALLPRHDVATAVFVLMYGSAVVGVGWLTRHPDLFLRGMWALLLLLALRMATIWLVPLAPPLDMLPMPDPFTARMFHTATATAITKDLFFSGHTATVALLAMAVRGRWWRSGLALASVLVGALVLVQRVHYTYDVLAAPLFTWLAYWAGGRIARLAAEQPEPAA
ncbi:phosphatase PAP2-related protein [Hymenobacter sp. UV11]|uniref:phosphatase PAP2-related protein n=1 Tax=Hymenobacter sp. UV11 TaxID=1849735 RepID=UPI0010D9EB73|nr:phosphatase PAP2-related protein [Hymenobacter sp. UV11]TDN38957.1 hypothetical protein A8B98_20875 [Hymenobacter sp. UV11]